MHHVTVPAATAARPARSRSRDQFQSDCGQPEPSSITSSTASATVVRTRGRRRPAGEAPEVRFAGGRWRRCRRSRRPDWLHAGDSARARRRCRRPRRRRRCRCARRVSASGDRRAARRGTRSAGVGASAASSRRWSRSPTVVVASVARSDPHERLLGQRSRSGHHRHQPPPRSSGGSPATSSAQRRTPSTSRSAADSRIPTLTGTPIGSAPGYQRATTDGSASVAQGDEQRIEVHLGLMRGIGPTRLHLDEHVGSGDTVRPDRGSAAELDVDHARTDDATLVGDEGRTLLDARGPCAVQVAPRLCDVRPPDHRAGRPPRQAPARPGSRASPSPLRR